MPEPYDTTGMVEGRIYHRNIPGATGYGVTYLYGTLWNVSQGGKIGTEVGTGRTLESYGLPKIPYGEQYMGGLPSTPAQWGARSYVDPRTGVPVTIYSKETPLEVIRGGTLGTSSSGSLYYTAGPLAGAEISSPAARVWGVQVPEQPMGQPKPVQVVAERRTLVLRESPVSYAGGALPPSEFRRLIGGGVPEGWEVVKLPMPERTFVSPRGEYYSVARGMKPPAGFSEVVGGELTYYYPPKLMPVTREVDGGKWIETYALTAGGKVVGNIVTRSREESFGLFATKEDVGAWLKKEWAETTYTGQFYRGMTSEKNPLAPIGRLAWDIKSPLTGTPIAQYLLSAPMFAGIPVSPSIFDIAIGYRKATIAAGEGDFNRGLVKFWGGFGEEVTSRLVAIGPSSQVTNLFVPELQAARQRGVQSVIVGIPTIVESSVIMGVGRTFIAGKLKTPTFEEALKPVGKMEYRTSFGFRELPAPGLDEYMAISSAFRGQDIKYIGMGEQPVMFGFEHLQKVAEGRIVGFKGGMPSEISEVSQRYAEAVRGGAKGMIDLGELEYAAVAKTIRSGAVLEDIGGGVLSLRAREYEISGPVLLFKNQLIDFEPEGLVKVSGVTGNVQIVDRLFGGREGFPYPAQEGRIIPIRNIEFVPRGEIYPKLSPKELGNIDIATRGMAWIGTGGDEWIPNIFKAMQGIEELGYERVYTGRFNVEVPPGSFAPTSEQITFIKENVPTFKFMTGWDVEWGAKIAKDTFAITKGGPSWVYPPKGEGIGVHYHPSSQIPAVSPEGFATPSGGDIFSYMGSGTTPYKAVVGEGGVTIYNKLGAYYSYRFEDIPFLKTDVGIGRGGLLYETLGIVKGEPLKLVTRETTGFIGASRFEGVANLWGIKTGVSETFPLAAGRVMEKFSYTAAISKVLTEYIPSSELRESVVMYGGRGGGAHTPWSFTHPEYVEFIDLGGGVAGATVTKFATVGDLGIPFIAPSVAATQTMTAGMFAMPIMFAGRQMAGEVSEFKMLGGMEERFVVSGRVSEGFRRLDITAQERGIREERIISGREYVIAPATLELVGVRMAKSVVEQPVTMKELVGEFEQLKTQRKEMTMQARVMELRTVQEEIFEPRTHMKFVPERPPYWEEPPPPFPIASGFGLEGKLPRVKSKILGGKRGRGFPNPIADILSVQRTQARFRGRATQQPLNIRTLVKWREAAGAGFGRGFKTLELERMPKRTVRKIRIFGRKRKGGIV